MKKPRKDIPNKIRAILQQEIGSVCPFCSNKDVAHFEVHHIDGIPDNNDLSNLIMLCPTCHSKIEKGEISKDEVVKTKFKISSVIHVVVDEEIKPMIAEIKKLIDDRNYDEAEQIYQKAKTISERKFDEYTTAKLDMHFATILKDKYFDVHSEDALLMKCLNVFEKYKQEEDSIHTKEHLAQTKASLGDYYSAEIFINDAIDYAKQKANDDDLSRALILLGFVHQQKDQLNEAINCMNEAIKLGVKLSHSDDEKEREKSVEVISYANHNKSFIYKQLGNIIESKSCCLKALEGHRKLNRKVELGKLLIEMAELEFFEGNLQAGLWKGYIEEAKNIFYELKNYSLVARCIDLVSKIAFSSGQKELSLEIFKAGYKEIKKTNDKRGIAYFLEHFATYFIAQKKYDEAEKQLQELLDYAKANDLKKSIIHAYQDLAKISFRKGDTSRQTEYLNYLLGEYEKQYSEEQSEAKKAYILGKIAFVHEQSNNYREALNIYTKISKIYEALNITSELAKTILIIAELNMRFGDRTNLFANWQKVSELVNGTAFYDFDSIAKANCGSYLMQTGDFISAERYLEEAHHLITKYKLRGAKEIEKLITEVKNRIDLSNPGKKTFPEMINRLYDHTIEKKSFDELLKYWYYRNEETLFKYFYNLSGVKVVLFNDEIKTVEATSKTFSWLFDYFLVVPTGEFEGAGHVSFIYPYELVELDEEFVFMLKQSSEESEHEKIELTFEEQLLQKLNTPSKDGVLPQFIVVPTQYSENKVIPFVYGWSKGLPKMASTFFNNKKASDIINGNLFVINVERHKFRDKFYSDLYLCNAFGCIATYFGEELVSEDVIVLGKVKVEIPKQISDKSKAAVVKKLFNSLFKVEKSKAKEILNDFKFDLDNLSLVGKESQTITVMIVELDYVFKNIIHPVIVLN